MSNVGDDAQQLLNKYLEQQSITSSAVGVQVALMFVLSVSLTILFCVVRPRNSVVYNPKGKYAEPGKEPPVIARGMFDWIGPLIHVKEEEMLQKAGLDAVTFLRFLRMLRYMFAVITLVCAAVTIPINIIAYNKKGVPDGQERQILSMLSVTAVTDNLLYAHVAVTYIVTFIIMAFVWHNYGKMVQLRQTWFRSPEMQEAFYARTLMVMDVDAKIRSDEGLRSMINLLQIPYPLLGVFIGRKIGDLQELVELHKKTVRELEKYICRYLRKGTIDGQKRPLIKGQDAINLYTEKLQKLEIEIQTKRDTIGEKSPESYGFFSMASAPYAHIVARILREKKPAGFSIGLAPNPRDIIWENYTRTKADRAHRNIVGWALLGLVCFVNTLPVLVLSLLANLNTVAGFWDGMKSWRDSSSWGWSFTVISGILPSAVSLIFGYFLPVLMRKLSRYQGATTRSRLDRAVIQRYYFFLVLTQFIIFSLIGVGVTIIKNIVTGSQNNESAWEILRDIGGNISTIPATYVALNAFWLTFIPLRGFLVIFDLAQVISLGYSLISRKFRGETPREVRERTAPPKFEFPLYYSNLLFLTVIGFAYAPLAPLVPLATGIVFWMSSISYKYQLMYIYVTKVESGGRSWNTVINRVLFSAIFMQLLVTLTIGLQRGWVMCSTVAPTIVLLVIFKFFLTKKFETDFMYFTPNQADINAARIHAGSQSKATNKLSVRFGQPALSSKLETVMVHQSMLSLLSEVYHGRLEEKDIKLKEYSGNVTARAQMVGNLAISGVEQDDILDPSTMRDRGEKEWDQMSLASTTLFGDDRSRSGTPIQRVPPYSNHNLTQSFDDFEGRHDSDGHPLLPAGGNNYYNYSPQQPQRPSHSNNFSQSSIGNYDSADPYSSNFDSSNAQTEETLNQHSAYPPYSHYNNYNDGAQISPPIPPPHLQQFAMSTGVTPPAEINNARSYMTSPPQSSSYNQAGYPQIPAPGQIAQHSQHATFHEQPQFQYQNEQPGLPQQQQNYDVDPRYYTAVRK